MHKLSLILSLILFLNSSLVVLATQDSNESNINSNTSAIEDDILISNENSTSTMDQKILNNSSEPLQPSNFETLEHLNKNIKYTKSYSELKAQYQNIDEKGIERQDFIYDMQGISSSYKLNLITDSKFETALALDNGDFIFINNFETFDQAMNSITKFRSENQNINGILSIINSSGLVVYAELAMGRVIKHINGLPDSTNSNITNIYTSNSLETAYTYINHGYIDDVPILSTNNSSTQIMVSGYKGWINNNYDSGNFDLIIVPLNQVTNPSYYITENGILYHFISSDILASSTKGHKIKIGIAPQYLINNKKYYSYDGNIFYEHLEFLVKDLSSNSTLNAINSNNPYYSYYNYLPFRSKTTLSASDLDNFIINNTKPESKLRGMGTSFINAQNIYGVNALLMLGIAINESAWGTSSIALSKNNIFGLNAVDQTPGESANYYKTVTDCINEFANYHINQSYINPNNWRYFGAHTGNKSNGLNVKYASDPFWGEKASNHSFTIDLLLSSNNINNLSDYNYYQLGMHTSNNNINDYLNNSLYKSKMNTPITILDTRNFNGSFRVLPDKSNSSLTGISSDQYGWNIHGFINSSNIKLINTGKFNGIFNDIKDHFAESAIEKFANKGFTLGYADGSFGHSNPITRAEFVKLVNKSFGFTNQAEESFNDVNPEDWFYTDIKIALANNFINTSFENFRPYDNITREEAAVIITNIKKNKDSNFDKIYNYSDHNLIAQWALTSVEGAIEAGYMGQNVSEFRPNANLSRAEAILTLERVTNF